MKKIIPKFIIHHWLKYFFLFFTILLLIITIAEVITGLLDSDPFFLILENFFYKLPDFLSKILPVNCLLASLFMMSRQKSTNELTAILGSGFSRIRYIMTVLFLVSFIAIFQFLLLAFISPQIFKYKYSQEISLKTLKKEGKFLARSFLGEGRTWYKNENYFVSFSQYLPASKTLKNVELYYYNKGKLEQQIITSKAEFNEKSHLWDFYEPQIISDLHTKNIHKYQTHKVLPIKLKEVPEDFKTFETDIKTFNFFKLFNFIKRLENTGIDTSSYIILFYEKITLSIICLIFAFFPLVSIKNPNNRSSSAGKNIALTLVFAIFYWFGHSTFLNLGANHKLLPIVASFMMPSLVSITLFFYWKKA